MAGCSAAAWVEKGSVVSFQSMEPSLFPSTHVWLFFPSIGMGG